MTFRRPELAAVTLVGAAPFFADWSASIRHKPPPGGRSIAVYTLRFTGRPGWARRVVEPVALAAFRVETRRRLRALAGYLARQAP